MARRVTWTNNSTSYDGTNIYRDTTIDPQNLPEPIATVDPVAQGATVKYIDLTGGGDQCYAVRDFDESGDGALSEAYCFEEDIFADAEIGDEIGGGIYAGTITYADSREFHIVFGLQSSETDDRPWGNYGTTTGADDLDDGWSNQEEVLNNHDDGSAEAFYHCRDYVDGDGNSDYHLPAENELDMAIPLVDMSHPEFSTNLSEQRWSSTELSSTTARSVRFTDGGKFSDDKRNILRIVRPVRRVAV